MSATEYVRSITYLGALDTAQCFDETSMCRREVHMLKPQCANALNSLRIRVICQEGSITAWPDIVSMPGTVCR